MATRIISAHLTKKGSVKIIYKQQEVGKAGIEEIFDAEYLKKSNQEAHRDLIHAFDSFVPHVMFRCQFVDKSVAIPTSIPDEDYFKKWHWEDDERFADLRVTGFKTFGKHAVEGIYVYAEKETEDGQVIPFRTPLISFDRNGDNPYALHVLASSQYETVEEEINKYAFEAKNVNTITNQLSMFPESKKAS